MSKENYRIAAAVCAAFVAFSLYQSGGDLPRAGAMPSGEQWANIAAAVVAAVSGYFGFKKDGGGADGGKTMGLLQAVQALLLEFKAKGIPDSFSVTVTWGDETYENDWVKRTRTEPKK